MDFLDTCFAVLLLMQRRMRTHSRQRATGLAASEFGRIGRNQCHQTLGMEMVHMGHPCKHRLRQDTALRWLMFSVVASRNCHQDVVKHCIVCRDLGWLQSLLEAVAVVTALPLGLWKTLRLKIIKFRYAHLADVLNKNVRTLHWPQVQVVFSWHSSSQPGNQSALPPTHASCPGSRRPLATQLNHTAHNKWGYSGPLLCWTKHVTDRESILQANSSPLSGFDINSAN